MPRIGRSMVKNAPEGRVTIRNVVSAGSTTFKREDVSRGFEPDACFYCFENASLKLFWAP